MKEPTWHIYHVIWALGDFFFPCFSYTTVLYWPIIHALWCVMPIVYWHWCSWPIVICEMTKISQNCSQNWCMWLGIHRTFTWSPLQFHRRSRVLAMHDVNDWSNSGVYWETTQILNIQPRYIMTTIQQVHDRQHTEDFSMSDDLLVVTDIWFYVVINKY